MIENISAENISEYGFLRLLVSTIALQGKTPFFNNEDLEIDLCHFYDNPSYQFLFKNIRKEKNAYEGYDYVDLSNAFEIAYALKLLAIIDDNHGIESFVNISREDAKINLFDFDNNAVKAMKNIVSYLYSSKKASNPFILVKSRRPYPNSIDIN